LVEALRRLKQQWKPGLAGKIRDQACCQVGRMAPRLKPLVCSRLEGQRASVVTVLAIVNAGCRMLAGNGARPIWVIKGDTAAQNACCLLTMACAW
jgi:aspartate-semialdehyde dehydrogenase